MPPDAPTIMLTDRAGVEQILGACGIDLRINVSRTTVVSTSELTILTFCLNYGTEETIAYCGTQYRAATLAKSWLAYTWASTIAAYLLCHFQTGSVPASLQSLYDMTMALLEKIHNAQFRPASMPSLSGAGVALDNLRLDPRWSRKGLRRESTISDGHRDQKSPVHEDIASLYLFERDR